MCSYSGDSLLWTPFLLLHSQSEVLVSPFCQGKVISAFFPAYCKSESHTLSCSTVFRSESFLDIVIPFYSSTHHLSLSHFNNLFMSLFFLQLFLVISRVLLLKQRPDHATPIPKQTFTLDILLNFFYELQQFFLDTIFISNDLQIVIIGLYVCVCVHESMYYHTG